MLKRSILGVLAFLGLASAFAQPVQVAATTGFIADMVRNVGGDRVTVVQVVPDGSDPHSFEPRPSVIQAVSRAQILFANGLLLEPFLERLEAQLPRTARKVKLAEGMPNLIKADPHAEGEKKDAHAGESAKDAHGHEHGEYDPHLWLDPTYGIRYVERIRDALIALDPAGRSAYTQNAARYIAQIRQADAAAKSCLAGIPQAQRRLVSQHKALQYFNRHYQITSIGTIADFTGQERGPASLVKLTQAMRRENVRVIFAEPQFPQGEARALAEATGARISRVYTDAFYGAVNTYLKLIQANGQAICQAFR
ncbi:metal ABC transporter substrate-binding protein [uncultured Meiothermus sp.]|jgi:zinc/manganese transport system substrate-binding protein/zinc transport system substrate-binding protein|uniref:metal ABC transporter substrate-binding protein n=1 Tax=uncultured Meiothermus sp. TaxID=157471 RepID=UPI002616E459|nr:metal ABC transporter substrate-binding protein [uncultured Meiothermus sp.]